MRWLAVHGDVVDEYKIPAGSIYNIASLVTRIGPKRLPMKTPVHKLYQQKIAHGLYGTMMGTVQVVAA